MQPERLSNGDIRIPRRAESDSGTIGDTMAVIGPGDPTFKTWDDYLKSIERSGDE